MIGPAQHQQMNRAEEQEGRVLARAPAAGQIEQLIAGRDGPAQRVVQRCNWSFAIVADFSDADAYVAYDRDTRHNELRDRLRPMAEQIARVQYEVTS